jgi:hypothetical protein
MRDIAGASGRWPMSDYPDRGKTHGRPILGLGAPGSGGQPRHKHFHLPHGLPLRRRAYRRIRLPSLSDWRLEPSVTRPKKKSSIAPVPGAHASYRRGPGCLWAKAGCRRCSPDSIKFKVATRRIEGLGTHLRRSFAGPHLLLVRIVQRLQRAHSIVRLFAPKGAC